MSYRSSKLPTADDRMMKRRYSAAILAGLAWAGLAIQFVWVMDNRAMLDLSRAQAVGFYFSFFTILTNLLLALTWTITVYAPCSAIARRLNSALFFGGLTCSIAFVGIVYWLFLSRVWSPQGWLRISDVLLHCVTPVTSMVYWAMYRDARKLSGFHPLLWSLYPLIYFFYVLIRGAMTGLYPYYFVDVGQLGYTQTLVNAVVMLAAFWLLGGMLVVLERTIVRMKSVARESVEP